MTAAQEDEVRKSILGLLTYDWVQLPLVVSLVNEAISSEPYDTVTEESRAYVEKIIRAGELIAGSVSDSGFTPWPEEKEGRVDRALRLLPLGGSIRDEFGLWFDLPETKRANQSPETRPTSRPVSA